MKRFVFLFQTVLIVCALNCISQAGEDSSVITVKGTATVRGEDTARARDQAIEDAMRKAVEQGVGTYIDSETEVTGLDITLDRVYSKAEGYIREFEIESEGEQDGMYVVSANAVVLARNAVQDVLSDMGTLCFLNKKWHNPRVMVIVEESILNKNSTEPSAEMQIVKTLREKCFSNLVDSSALREINEKESARMAIGGDAESARMMGLQYGSEFMVVGKSNVDSCAKDVNPYGEKGDEGLVSCQAGVIVKVIQSTTGRILADDEKMSSAVGISEMVASRKAIRDAASKLAAELIRTIVSAPESEKTNIQIRITGADFQDLMAFEKGLKEIRGVRDVFRRSFDDGKLAVLEVETDFSAEEFSNQLSEADFNSVSFKITGYSGNTINLRCSSGE
jgi:hypothetical protein